MLVAPSFIQEYDGTTICARFPQSMEVLSPRGYYISPLIQLPLPVRFMYLNPCSVVVWTMLFFQYPGKSWMFSLQSSSNLEGWQLPPEVEPPDTLPYRIPANIVDLKWLGATSLHRWSSSCTSTLNVVHGAFRHSARNRCLLCWLVIVELPSFNFLLYKKSLTVYIVDHSCLRTCQIRSTTGHCSQTLSTPQC